MGGIIYKEVTVPSAVGKSYFSGKIEKMSLFTSNATTGFDTCTGKFLTLVPADFKIERNTFLSGQRFNRRKTVAWLRDFFHQETVSGKFCGAWYSQARKGDSSLARSNFNFHYYGENVFVWLEAPSKEVVSSVIEETSSGFMDLLPTTKAVDLNLEDMLFEVDLIAVDAFDGEGYLIWKKETQR